MTWSSLIGWTALFLALEAFFSGSELALVSADKLKLSHRAAQGSRGAKIALALAQRPEWFFSTTLLGQGLFIVANSVLVTFFIFNEFGVQYEFFGLLLSPLILIFGEAVPKSLFQQWADRLTPIVSPAVFLFSILFFPIVWPLSKLTLLLMGGVKGSLMTGHEVSRESLELLLRESEAPRELAPVFKKSLLKTLLFTKKAVHEIMTPLIEVFSLSETSDIGEAIAVLREEGYSYVPIFRRRAYNIVGVVKFFDLLFAKDLKAPLDSLMKEPFYVPLEMSVTDLFLAFRDQQWDFAVVMDEYGGAAGIVTLEDILEEVVGEIDDEYDEERVSWKPVGRSQFLVEGRMTIDAVNERLRLGLPKGHYETIAGFVLSQLGHFPKSGEAIHFSNLTIMVKTATPRSVDEVLVEIED